MEIRITATDRSDFLVFTSSVLFGDKTLVTLQCAEAFFKGDREVTPSTSCFKVEKFETITDRWVPWYHEDSWGEVYTDLIQYMENSADVSAHDREDFRQHRGSIRPKAL